MLGRVAWRAAAAKRQEPTPPVARRSGMTRLHDGGIARRSCQGLIDLQPGHREVGEPPFRIALQASPQQAADGGWRRRRQQSPVRLLREHERQRVGDVVGIERTATRQHLVEHGAKRPDVGPLVHRSAARLLRGHVRRGAQNDPGGRGMHRDGRGCRGCRSRRTVLFEGFREAEIEDLDRAILADLDVGRLQVTMDDAGRVRGFHRLDDLPGDRERFIEGHRAGSEPIGQGRSLDQLHDQGALPARIFEAVNVGDVGVIERGQQLGFAIEPRQSIDVVDDGVP